MTAADRLRSAQALLKSGAFDEALDLVCQAWREHPCADLAELVRLLGDLQDVDPVRPPSHHRKWMQRCERGTAKDVGPLLAGLMRPATYDSLAERVAALAAKPPDPRINALVIEEIQRPTHKMWSEPYERLVDIVLASGDPEAISTLQDVAAKASRLKFWNATSTVGRIRRAEVPERHDLDEAAAASAAALRMALTSRATRPASTEHVAALLEAVYEEPGDDERRAVYADALQELGDPRGELIALQLARGIGGRRSRRERDLLAQHEKKWIEPIGELLVPGRNVFERGFLHACTYKKRAKKDQVGHPMWSTVHEILVRGIARPPGPVPVLVHDVMRALRSVRGVRYEFLDSILDHERPLPWTTLGLREPRFDRPMLHRLSESVVLSSVRRLELFTAYQASSFLQDLANAEFVGRLNAIEIETERIAETVDALARLPNLTELTIDAAQTPWVLERGDAGWTLSVDLRKCGPGQAVPCVTAFARTLKRGELRRARLRMAPAGDGRRNTHEKAAKALRRVCDSVEEV